MDRNNRWIFIKKYFEIKEIIRQLTASYQKGVTCYDEMTLEPIVGSAVNNYRELFLEFLWWSDLVLQAGFLEAEYVVHKGKAFPKRVTYALEGFEEPVVKYIPKEAVLHHVIVQNTLVAGTPEVEELTKGRNQEVFKKLDTYSIVHGYFDTDGIFCVVCLYTGETLQCKEPTLKTLVNENPSVRILKENIYLTDGLRLLQAERPVWELIKHEENISSVEQTFRDKFGDKGAPSPPLN